MKKNKIGGACSTQGSEKKVHTEFGGQNLREGTTWKREAYMGE